MRTSNRTIDIAYNLAVDAHAGQYRKYDDLDYIAHPMAVVETFCKVGREQVNERNIAVAYLHDVVEDTTYGPKDIREAFRDGGHSDEHIDYICEGVHWLTDPVDNADRATRKKRVAARYALPLCPDYVHTIKCCDIVDNIKGLKENNPDFFPRYAKEKLNLLESLTRATEPARTLAYKTIAFELAGFENSR